MQIVIDIDDKTYKAFTELIAINLGRSIYKSIIEKCLIAIQNGVVLPKGHGRLIDADKIEWYGCDFEDGAMCRKNSGNCGICIFAECDADQVRNLPTIIEADKADKKPTCGDCKEWGTVNCPETYREPTKNDDICDSFKIRK